MNCFKGAWKFILAHFFYNLEHADHDSCLVESAFFFFKNLSLVTILFIR